MGSVLLTKYYSSDQTKQNEIGRACGTYGKKYRCFGGFWWGKLSKRGHLEGVDIEGRMIRGASRK